MANRILLEQKCLGHEILIQDNWLMASTINTIMMKSIDENYMVFGKRNKEGVAMDFVVCHDISYPKFDSGIKLASFSINL